MFNNNYFQNLQSNPDSIARNDFADQTCTNLEAKSSQKRMRIALVSYRSNPHCGGQGIYVKYLSKALADLGHQVDVISGEPYPDLDSGVRLIPLPGLNLYNYSRSVHAIKQRGIKSAVDLFEWFSYITGGFPEPFTFGKRLANFLQKNAHHYDLIHDNQSLCYGLIKLQTQKIPVVSTIHHPITKDLGLALENEPDWGIRLLIRRWHSFLKMQKKVAPKLQQIITVSKSSQKDLIRDFSLNPENIDVVYNGVDHVTFSPQPDVKKDPNRIMATASADVPLKGLLYLLKALTMLSSEFPDLRLVVLGSPKKDGVSARLIEKLGITDKVKFVKGISSRELAQEYAKSSLAVVPSLYEGFGLPAAEAMSCGVPVVSTTGGALSEVVGDAGLLVPPGDPESLASAIRKLLNDPNLQKALGQAGRQRILEHFTWQKAADKTANIYQQVIDSKQDSYNCNQISQMQRIP
mgnify:CR=1 FL=1